MPVTMARRVVYRRTGSRACYIKDMTFEGSSSDPRLAYPRAARRVRWRWRKNPSRMHQRLAELASAPTEARETMRIGPEVWARQVDLARDEARGRVEADWSADRWVGRAALSPAGERFAQLVAAQVDAGVLRHDHRQRLLSAAAGMRVERFEANLVIALLQHRYRLAEATAPRRRTRGQVVRVIGALIVMEACILGVSWWVWG